MDDSSGAVSVIPDSFTSVAGYTPYYTHGKCEDKERGVKLFAGYRAHENFGAELGYLAADGFASATDVDFSHDALVGRSPLGDLIATTDTSLFYLAGVGYYPVSEQFSLLGKAGVHRYKKETKVDLDSRIPNARNNIKLKDDGIGLLAGIGAQYDFAALPLSLRGEYEYARLDSSSSLRLLSFSLVWRI